MDYLKGTGYENKIVSAEEIISPLRGRKSDKELAIMQEAVDETLKIFDMVTNYIKPGLSEKDIADYVLKITKEKSLEDEGFEEFLKAAFTQPRKKLIRNLSALMNMDALEEKFSALGMDTNIRPHEATVTQYENIYKFIKETFNGKQ